MRCNGIFIELSKDENGILDNSKNTITHDNTTFLLKPLSENYDNSKGGNSSVFQIMEGEDDNNPKVIKICNIPRPDKKASQYKRRRYGRFINEIEALYVAKEKNINNIIRIEFDGELQLGNRIFSYYVMEKADSDLTEFIHSNIEVDNQEKIKFCIDIFDSIRNLSEIGYYHRDIKPDNVLLFYKSENQEPPEGFNWKIGDLGLTAHRDKDFDEIGERIGAFGWISQEAMNKFFTEKKKLDFDCKIDTQSDIFQLGKIYWFIFMKNCPIGQLYYKDFNCKINYKRKVWRIIITLLSSIKSRRPNINELENRLFGLKKHFTI